MPPLDVAQGVDAGMFVRDYHPKAESGALVYLHGLGDHGRSFEPIAAHERLASFRHLVPDLPGHGNSVPAARPTPLVAFADHFARFVLARLERPVTLIGHGLGAVIALLVAERHERLVQAVVDIEGPKSADDCGSLSTAGRPTDARVFCAWARELVDHAVDGMLAARLGALPMPTLFVSGKGGNTSPRSLDLLAEAGVVVVEMPSEGPAPFIRDPQAFAAILGDFLGARTN